MSKAIEITRKIKRAEIVVYDITQTLDPETGLWCDGDDADPTFEEDFAEVDVEKGDLSKFQLLLDHVWNTGIIFASLLGMKSEGED